MGPYPHAQKFKTAIEIILLAGCRHFNKNAAVQILQEVTGAVWQIGYLLDINLTNSLK